MTRPKLMLTILLVLLGVASIGTVVILQARADESRAAELKLSATKLELAQLQNAPFHASRSTGGSAAFAAQQLRAGTRWIYANLAELERGDAPRPLRDLQAPLAANLATLQRIYRIGVATNAYGPDVDRLAGQATVSQAAISTLLDEAGRTYGQRAARSRDQATAGAAAAILMLLCAFGFLYRKNGRLLESSQHDARVDALTGLPNRRALVHDLAEAIERATPEHPLLLGLFDLDGFKQYNDTFGHPAGDALLTRLGGRLQAGLLDEATAYRMGGDEFCVLAWGERARVDEVVRLAAAALSDSGESFAITCSYGEARLPAEASTAEQALHLADQRMYARKTRAPSAIRQSSAVLLRVISERSDALDEHVGGVAHLARLLAERLELPEHEQERIFVAAQLHDIGKTALPDSLLDKAGPLNAEEWRYMHRHTLIGERIVLAAPSLAPTGALIRSSHERIDGTGYPDGMRGDRIPLGSRIIAVCDAYDSMVSDRAYRPAMAQADALQELRRNAGSQFDAKVVRAFVELVHQLADEPQLLSA